MRRGSIHLLVFFAIAVAVLAGFVFLERNTGPLTDSVESVTDETQADAPQDSVADTAQRAVTEREVLTSTPLRGPTALTPSANLSVAGVLEWTNRHRADVGLPPLSLNTQLNAAALLKARDMFEQQYFAHESPQGVNVGDLADRVGYEYILIGENLALGNYNGDRDLVQAWMDSPGHRENILHERFTNIGIAVLKSTFEGHTVWMAVQEFGLPLSACPSPNASLAEDIDENREELAVLGDELEERQDDLENTEPKFGPVYNRKVREYNELVAVYNDLVKETKVFVEEYNGQVGVFNQCASG